MKHTKSLCLIAYCLFFNTIFSQSPNVVVIIADDMGWSQVSTGLTNLNNQSDFYETPTIETLASEGIAFPHGYVNGANCAPTRAALLSGQYAARPTNNIFAVDHLNRGGNSTLLVGPDNGLPNGIDELPVSAITLAETMKTAGYTTVHLGKYHVGENESTNSSDNAATDQGFDVNYGGGTKGNPGEYKAINVGGGTWEFHSSIGPELDVYADPYTEAESLLLTGDKDLIQGEAKHVTDAMTDAAIDFIDTNINTPFFMHFSNYAIHGPLGESNCRSDLYAKYQTKNSNTPSSMGHTNISIGAIAEGMDQSINRLITHLKTTDDPRNPGKKLSENTLIYFISDNGGALNTEENGPLRGKKGDLYEGGIRSITFVWSEASWLANKGTVNTTPVIGFDIYPTFVEAAGGTLPSGYDIDGVSHWSMLTGTNSDLGRDALFWHFPGYIRDQTPVTVIRKGDYKLIHFYETASYEMYNLINDISETTNLLPSSDQAVIDLANGMITDMRAHLTDTSAPLPTYRSGGATVPMPDFVTISSSNSTDGCQAENSYIAYWDFDIVSGTNDASGGGNNAISGVPTYDSSDFKEGDQSVVFDGSTEIQYSSGSFLTASTSKRSVSVWIKPTSLTGTQEIFEEGGSGNGMALRLNGSDLEARMTSGTETNFTISTSYPADSDWHHIALVFDGANTSLELYIDGVLETSTTSALTVLATHSSPGGVGGVITGDAFGSGTNDSFFTGKMDAFAIYDSVLTLTEIRDAACYVPSDSTAGCQAEVGYEAYWDFDMANSANDASVNNHDPRATISGAITYDAVDFKEGDQSIVFDGTEAIQYGTNSGSPDSFLNSATNVRSIAVWIKPTLLSGIQNIFDEGGKNKGIAVRLNGATMESIIRDTSSSADQISATIPNDSDWHHITIVYDGANTSHKMYVDGVEVASSNTAPSIVPSNLSYGGIGGKLSGTDSFNNSSDAFFKGKMDAFALYNIVLSETQVENSACSGTLDSSNNLFNDSYIYPNPFRDKININLKNNSNDMHVVLYTILGKSVFSGNYTNNNKIEIPVSELAKGLYVLRVTSNNETITRKLIKN